MFIGWIDNVSSVFERWCHSGTLRLPQFGRECHYVYGGVFGGTVTKEVLKMKCDQSMSLGVYFSILVDCN